jgi:hypothetical protein
MFLNEGYPLANAGASHKNQLRYFFERFVREAILDFFVVAARGESPK